MKHVRLIIILAFAAFLIPAFAEMNISGGGSLPTLVGTTSSIGGGALLAGACATGTVAVIGSTTGMPVVAAPAAGTDPTNGGVLGVAWEGRVSVNGTVTVSVCAPIAGTPAAAAYNVRVIQ